MDQKEAALRWAAQGRAVFPLWWRYEDGRCACGLPLCGSPGKHPRISKGFHVATTDKKQIRAWWTRWPHANIGMATGRPSGLVVLDVDEDVGIKSMNKIDEPVPDTYTVVTQGGGLHLYFKAPDHEVRGRIRFLPGLDLRGDGGYVVVPPSPGYEVAFDAPVADYDWLHKLLRSTVFSRIARSKGPLKIPKRIPEGQRHHVLFRYACRLRQAGQEEEEILEAVLKLNEERCDPPEDLDVLAAQVEDVCLRYPKGPEEEHRRYDEVGLVDRIRMELASPEADSISTREQHWFYDQGVWTPLGDDGVAAFLHAWKDEVYHTADDRVRTFRPTITKINNVSRHIKLIDYREHFFDDRPRCLAFSNGVVFPDGTLVGHSSDHRLQFARPEDYDPDAECPLWEAFLDVTFAGPDSDAKKAILQEFAGAALFGAAPRYEKAMILVGPGANGKSVILKVMEGMMPPGSVTAIPPHDMHQEYRRAMLATSLLNIVSEVPSKELKESESIKAIISGDVIEGRQIREKEFRFRPAAAHLFAANMLPDVNDFTFGFRRKWLILTCPNTVAPDDQVPDLGGKMLDYELQGILRWAVDGMIRVERQGGYTKCKASDKEVMTWLRASDPVADFVEECCTIDNGEFTDRMAAYHKYAVWCPSRGRPRMARRKFFKRFANYVKPVRTSKKKGFRCKIEMRIY